MFYDDACPKKLILSKLLLAVANFAEIDIGAYMYVLRKRMFEVYRRVPIEDFVPAGCNNKMYVLVCNY